MRRLTLCLLLLVPAARAEDDRPDRRAAPQLQERIHKAINRGVAYLKRVQAKDGSWDHGRFGLDGTGGLTALALYALAASKVPASDRAIRRGLRWTELHETPFSPAGRYGTYSVSLLILALTRIDARKHATRIQALAELLAAGQLDSDLWTYRLAAFTQGRKGRRAPFAGRRGDNSNSQFAVLALWAARALAGAAVPKTTWKRIRDLYERTQLPGGGWPYSPRAAGAGGLAPARPSMTSAGLCSYVYATAALNGGPAALPAARKTPVARRGREALLSSHDQFDFANYYFDYALERAGTVMAIPEDLWYFEGALALVAAQDKSGRWGQGPGRGDRQGVYATSLALLFLSRATRYAITPGGDPNGRGWGPTTKTRDAFPDPAKELERAFDYYAALKPEPRAGLATRFGRAGPKAVGLFIRRLAHKSRDQRAAAFELLEKLVEKRFFFESGWPPEERDLMLHPIQEWWNTTGDRLRWDKARGVFRVG